MALQFAESITINAPVEDIYRYLANVQNQPEVWPSLTQIDEVEDLPDGSCTYRWTYKMAGIRFEGSARDTRVPNARITTVTEGGISSTQVFRFEPGPDGTKVTVEVQYLAPSSVTGTLGHTFKHLALGFVTRLNQNEARSILKNLKTKMEAK